jgi:hypothetical protein
MRPITRVEQTKRSLCKCLPADIAVALLSLIVLGGATAWANPIFVGPPPVTAYLSSEHLSVSISATDAVLRGSFTLRHRSSLAIHRHELEIGEVVPFAVMERQ